MDVQAIGIAPHMHYIGKEMKVVAETPDGKTIPMIWIKDWDFNWQGQYQYSTPVKLPKGTVIKLDAYYDNSADNPSNPNKPPKTVHWGEQTTDEMCLLGVQVVTNTMADLRSIITMRGNRSGGGPDGGRRGRCERSARPWRGLPVQGPSRPDERRGIPDPRTLQGTAWPFRHEQRRQAHHQRDRRHARGVRMRPPGLEQRLGGAGENE